MISLGNLGTWTELLKDASRKQSMARAEHC